MNEGGKEERRSRRRREGEKGKEGERVVGTDMTRQDTDHFDGRPSSEA